MVGWSECRVRSVRTASGRASPTPSFPRKRCGTGATSNPGARPLFSATGFANFDGGRAAGEIDMKCFVAMAFSHEDTNRLYEETLSRALSAQGIDCVRIDRIDYNGDIDDRMMEEIESADLMIADLTYARPSVYYEAGMPSGRSRSSTRSGAII